MKTTRVLTRSFASGVVASLCQAEVFASGEMFEWLRLYEGEWHNVVVSDSQAALHALRCAGGQRLYASLGRVVGLCQDLRVTLADVLSLFECRDSVG